MVHYWFQFDLQATDSGSIVFTAAIVFCCLGIIRLLRDIILPPLQVRMTFCRLFRKILF